MDFQITKIASTRLSVFGYGSYGNIRLLFSLFDFKSGEKTVVMAANSFSLRGFCVVIDLHPAGIGTFMRLMVEFIFLQP